MTALLTAERISRRFGGIVAVSEFSFEIRPREVMGLIGPNGAGKSTTFNVISGFYKPSSGRLTFQGEDITGLSAPAISRRGLVRTFQHGSLLREMSVHDNILIGTLRAVRHNAERESRRTARPRPPSGRHRRQPAARVAAHAIDRHRVRGAAKTALPG